ncbi:AAA family ATPase [Arcicella sp. LKC2W]|uniref:AAA family ATPase n=1 Tax=Arcicella sp. LKC2W TaxID=2984198 RepID=UPI002B2029C5|nr:AAA family ATPase [Arcicella sp. LKC2W]MEA5457555.1 AAA family ATPase [Arcicella sp. LKC2W]
MKIKKLHIKNFKSIADLEIIEPNPFTVFVGPNGSGKSNIFEALEFFCSSLDVSIKLKLFGGEEELKSFRNNDIQYQYFYSIETDTFVTNTTGQYFSKKDLEENPHSFRVLSLSNVTTSEKTELEEKLIEIFNEGFSRVFVSNQKIEKLPFSDSSKLNLSTSNLEKVLKRILKDSLLREEISDWLSLFIPGFERVEVISSELSGTDTLVIYEKGTDRPFTKNLLSDGTYNILALLTAVFQSDEPQFLCIEEPENGLNPKVIKELVGLFRYACEEKGHYIWLNTHSQSLVSQLEPHEIILVNKKEGETKVKQLKKDLNLYGLPMDEAWLSNALGGGLPW